MSTKRQNYNGVCERACACVCVKPCLFRYDEIRARRLQPVQPTEGPVPLEGGGRRVGLPKKSRHMGPRRRKTRSLKWSSRLAEDRGFICSKLSLRVSPFLIWFDLVSFFFSLTVSAPMMISKVKNAMTNLVGGMMPHGHHHHHHNQNHHGQSCEQDSLPPRFPYGRPEFLDLTPELLQYSTEHASRPVLALKRGSRLPWKTGYAEWVQIPVKSEAGILNYFWCRLGDLFFVVIFTLVRLHPELPWAHCSTLVMAHVASGYRARLLWAVRPYFIHHLFQLQG